MKRKGSDEEDDEEGGTKAYRKGAEGRAGVRVQINGRGKGRREIEERFKREE